MGQVMSPMGAYSASGDTAPVIIDCHPGRPWRTEITFNLWSSIMKKITARYDHGTAFFCYPCTLHNSIFDRTLTAGAIGSEPYCEFSNPVASALKPFLKSPLILRAFRSYPLGGRTYPTRRKSQFFAFFTGHFCYSGTTPSTIYWAFMTIHNSSQSHYHII